MLEVTVDRAKWYRGQGPRHSRLLSKRGMCCLGFGSLAAGLHEEDIAEQALPHKVRNKLPFSFPSALLTLTETDEDDPTLSYMSTIGYKLSMVNDDREVDDTERERVLTDLGLKVNIAFTDEDVVCQITAS